MASISLPTPRQVARYGWRRQNPDKRDLHAASPIGGLELPRKISKRFWCTAVYDQKNLGSCTANALAAGLDFERLAQGLPAIYPSRLFIYFCERNIEGSTDQDAGAVIRDGMLVLDKVGACPEVEWPYDETKFAHKPTPGCYESACLHKALKYAAITQTLYTLKYQLAVVGRPIVFGFTVYESFESKAVEASGIMPMPNVDKEEVVGGHAVLCVGYDDDKPYPGGVGMVEVRNSWGPAWGDAGYFWMPYAYIADPQLASDFWEIRLTA